MSLLERARSDVKAITSNDNHFAVEMTFTATDGSTATVNGLFKKHHTGVDEDGQIVNSKIASVSVAEAFLELAGYPVRAGGEVKLKDHRVSVADSTGETKNYIIKEWYPDETLGLIVCILSWG